MRHITTNRITPPQITFFVPEPPFGDEGSTGDGTMDRVAGEQLPDFSSLPTAEPPAAPAPIEEDDAPITEEDDNKDDEEAARKAEEEARKKEEDDKSEQRSDEEDAAKAEEQKKAEEAKTKVQDNSDLDAIQVRENAPKGVKRDVAAMKEIVRNAREEKQKIAAELETLRAEQEVLRKQVEERTQQQAPPEVEEELNSLREQLAVLQGENDPELQREFDEKRTNAEDKLFAFLKRQRLTDAAIDEIKRVGWDKWTKWGKVKETMAARGVQVETEYNELIRERFAVDKEREKKIEELKTKRGSLDEMRAESDKKERLSFAENFTKHVQESFETDHKWIKKLDVPANATPEKRAEIEAHNKEIDSMVEEFKPTLQAMYGRDPKAVAKVVLESLQSRKLAKDIAAKDSEIAKIKAAHDADKKRLAELEGRVAKIKDVGRVSRIDTSGKKPAARPNTAPDGTERPVFPWEK